MAAGPATTASPAITVVPRTVRTTARRVAYPGPAPGPTPSRPPTGQLLLPAEVAREVWGARLSAMGGMGGYGGGGYHGARGDRTSTAGWHPGGGSPAADVLPSLPELRARCRDLSRNNALAAGALANDQSAVVGAGLTYQSRIDRELLREVLGLTDAQADAWQAQAEREVRLRLHTPEMDVGRLLAWGPFVGAVNRARRDSGDVGVLITYVTRPRPIPGRLALQLIEADRISNPQWTLDTPTRQAGVELDPETGAPLAVHIQDQHPGDALIASRGWTWTRREIYRPDGRPQVLLLKNDATLRPGLHRGVPHLATIVEALRGLGRYTDLELQAAVSSAWFGLVVESPTGEPLGPEQRAAVYDGDMPGYSPVPAMLPAPGSVLNLLPGEKAYSPSPGRPNTAFDGFVAAVSQWIGAAIGQPKEVLVRHFQASYSASRAAFGLWYQVVLAERQYLADALCQPVVEATLEESILLGRLQAPGFFADPALRAAWCGSEWHGPARPQIQAGAENEADALAQAMGWTTGAANAAARGQDWDRVQGQLRREAEVRAAAGLGPTPAPSTITGAGPDNSDGPPGPAPAPRGLAPVATNNPSESPASEPGKEGGAAAVEAAPAAPPWAAAPTFRQRLAAYFGSPRWRAARAAEQQEA